MIESQDKTLTCEDFIKMALSLFDETDVKDYEVIAKNAVNVILAESFKVNNGLREEKEKEKLPCIPFIESKADVIPYEYELIVTALIYGLAAKLYWKDGEPATVDLFLQQYSNGLKEFRKVKVVDYGSCKI